MGIIRSSMGESSKVPLFNTANSEAFDLQRFFWGSVPWAATASSTGRDKAMALGVQFLQFSHYNENKTAAMLGGAESEAWWGDEEQTVQTLIDAVILSALLPGVSCAEQLLAESFLLSCLLFRPSDLLSFLTFFLSS